MRPETHKRYLEILELTGDASLYEIREAYLNLKALYSTDSIVTLPARDEVSEARNREILQEIEEAYHGLTECMEKRELSEGHPKHKGAVAGELDSEWAEISRFDGQTLREIRERRGIDIEDIALSTMIQARYLEYIENEAFDDLPPETYVRGFVVSYSKHLGLDSKKVADDYMTEYHAWKSEKHDKPQ